MSKESSLDSDNSTNSQGISPETSTDIVIEEGRESPIPDQRPPPLNPMFIDTTHEEPRKPGHTESERKNSILKTSPNYVPKKHHHSSNIKRKISFRDEIDRRGTLGEIKFVHNTHYSEKKKVSISRESCEKIAIVFFVSLLMFVLIYLIWESL